MSYKFLDLPGLQRFLNKVKALIPTKTSELQNDSGYTTADTTLSGTSENALQNKVIKNALDLKANDSGVVHTTGNESISGTKSFNSDLNLNYASTDVDDIVDSIPGLGTVEDYVHISGAETISGVKTFSDGIVANVSGTATPLSHTHGNLTNDGKIGTTSNKPVITGTNGVLTAGAFGTSANTFCEGNDSRLSDARTPVSHSHGSISNDGKLANGNKVVITNANKIITESSVTDTELGYLSGVTSSVQTQISTNDSNAVHTTGDESISGTKSFNSDLNLNYANTDVDDIVDSTPGTGTSDIFVHNTGAETISGVKTFSDGIVANVSGNCTKDGSGNVITSTYGALSANNTWSATQTIYNSALELKYSWVSLGTYPQDRAFYGAIRVKDNANNQIFLQRGYVASDGYSGWYCEITPLDGVSSHVFLTFDINSNGDTCMFRPGNGNSISLGTSGNRWKSVYADSYYYGTTKWGLDQSNVWTGLNTFNADIVAKNYNYTRGTVPSANKYSTLAFTDNSNNASARLLRWFNSTGLNGLSLQVWDAQLTTDTSARFQLQYDPSGNAQAILGGDNFKEFVPLTNNSIDLGTSTKKWKTFNGVNPGALSLPNLSVNSAAGSNPPNGYVDIDTTNWDLTGANSISYTPPVDGWISIRGKDEVGNFIFATQICIRQSVLATGALSTLASGLSLVMPVNKNVAVTIYCKVPRTSLIAYFTPCQGNV